MAKKPTKPTHTAQDVIRKDGGAAYAIDGHEWEVPEGAEGVSGEIDNSITVGADNTVLWAYDHLATDSEGKPRLIVPDDTPMQHVGFILPRAVLIALLDPAHELADADAATGLGLLVDGELTALGSLVISGTDKTALGHKMAAAWRVAHNAEVLNKKG